MTQSNAERLAADTRISDAAEDAAQARAEAAWDRFNDDMLAER